MTQMGKHAWFLALASTLVVGCASRRPAAAPLSRRAPERRLEVRTDSSTYTAHRNPKSDAIEATFGIVVTNRGTEPVYLAGGTDQTPTSPALYTRTADGWVWAFSRNINPSQGSPVVVAPGQSYRQVYLMHAGLAEFNAAVPFKRGTYRLQLRHVYDSPSGRPDTAVPDSLLNSNEFELREE